jgi:hypothetical protein
MPFTSFRVAISLSHADVIARRLELANRIISLAPFVIESSSEKGQPQPASLSWAAQRAVFWREQQLEPQRAALLLSAAHSSGGLESPNCTRVVWSGPSASSHSLDRISLRTRLDESMKMG